MLIKNMLIIIEINKIKLIKKFIDFSIKLVN